MKKPAEAVLDRLNVESEEQWREWLPKIPAIPMLEGYSITVVPPFAGAMARMFVVHPDGTRVSAYLDVYDRLGVMGQPYWEVYPGVDGGDPDRCPMDDVLALTRLLYTQRTKEK